MRNAAGPRGAYFPPRRRCQTTCSRNGAPWKASRSTIRSTGMPHDRFFKLASAVASTRTSALSQRIVCRGMCMCLSVRLISQGSDNSFPVARYLDQPRASTAASYNADLPIDQLDKSKRDIRAIPPAQRSMTQAYYMVWTWATEAVKKQEGRK